jgi:hypothetical protein
MWNRRPTRTDRSERWKREDAAPRLAEEVPQLRTLSLVLRDSRGLQGVAGTERTQHVVVGRAAALFEIACSDTHCVEGGHDLTHEILSALRRRVAHFEGTNDCGGSIGQGGGQCRCTLHYTVRAGYADDAKLSS